MQQDQRKPAKTVVGVVASDHMQKTIVVHVTRLVKHAKYGKYLRRVSRFVAHDERDEAKAGDTVEIAETRPRSKTKAWRLVRVVR